MKFWSQDENSVVSEKSGDSNLQKVGFKHYDRLKL